MVDQTMVIEDRDPGKAENAEKHPANLDIGKISQVVGDVADIRRLGGIPFEPVRTVIMRKQYKQRSFYQHPKEKLGTAMAANLPDLLLSKRCEQKDHRKKTGCFPIERSEDIQNVIQNPFFSIHQNQSQRKK
jgi:hypothetical protein